MADNVNVLTGDNYSALAWHYMFKQHGIRIKVDFISENEQ